VRGGEWEGENEKEVEWGQGNGKEGESEGREGGEGGREVGKETDSMCVCV
jgi:hypothetical protein